MHGISIESYHVLSTLQEMGVHIEVRGDRLRYFPRSVVTADLAERMKMHKDELLVILRHYPESPRMDALRMACTQRVDRPVTGEANEETETSTRLQSTQPPGTRDLEGFADTDDIRTR